MNGIASALRAVGVAEVDEGTRRRAEYSTDASNYRVVPQAVVFPRDADEVAATVEVARTHGVPVTVRGGGTSTAGNSVGVGVVLDFSRYLNRVIAVDPQARTARAEPGAILDDITAAAAPHGLRFGPDHRRMRGLRSAVRSATTRAAPGPCATAGRPTTSISSTS